MAKRQVEFDDKHLKLTALIFSLIGSVFAGYMFLSAEFIDPKELAISQQPQDVAQEAIEEDLATRIRMSESTRYAQVAKYYRDEMKERDLTTAEWARLELVEREQCRIRNELAESESEVCD